MNFEAPHEWGQACISIFSKWHFAVSYDAILLGVVVSAVVGIFFGFYPARQAARLNPIEALRSE